MKALTIFLSLLLTATTSRAQQLALLFEGADCENVFPEGPPYPWPSTSEFVIRVVSSGDRAVAGAEFAIRGIPISEDQTGYRVVSVSPHPAASTDGDLLGSGARITFIECEDGPIDLFTIQISRGQFAPSVSVRDILFASVAQPDEPSLGCPTLTVCDQLGPKSVCTFGAAERMLPAPDSPLPANGQNDVALDATISWNTYEHNVVSCWLSAPMTVIYFGTEPVPELREWPVGASYEPGRLSPHTTYYWRVITFGYLQHAESPIWSFTTGGAVATASKSWSRLKQLYR